MAALDEAIRIGREAGIPVEIFHIKTAGQTEFWQDARCSSEDRGRSTRRSRCQRRYVRLSGVVKPAFCLRSSLGAGWWECQNDRALARPGHPCPHPPGPGNTQQQMGERVAGDWRSGGCADWGSAESRTAPAAREDSCRCRQDLERGPLGCPLRPRHQGRGLYRSGGLRDLRTRHRASPAATLGVDLAAIPGGPRQTVR